MIRQIFLSAYLSMCAFSFFLIAPSPAHAAQMGVQPNQDSQCGLPNFQPELLQLIQSARAHGRVCGNQRFAAAGPLAWNSQLAQAATGHSADMANRNYFNHQSWDGTPFSVRISRAGYRWSNVGENISAGRHNVNEVMNAWLQSPHHCANIMAAKFAEVGVACIKNPRSTYQYYWSMELGHH